MSQEFADFTIEFEQNLEDVQAWGGEQRPLVPPGDYTLTVVGVEQKTSSGNNPMVVVTFEVADGEQQGSKLWGNYALTQKAMGRIKQLMIACGAGLSKFQASELMGSTLIGTVIHTQGQASVDAEGNAREARTFANVINERPIEAPKAETKAPPVTKQGTTTAKPNGTGAARRA